MLIHLNVILTSYQCREKGGGGGGGGGAKFFIDFSPEKAFRA